MEYSKRQTSLMLKTVTSLNESEARITQKLNHFSDKLNHGLAELHELESWYRVTDTTKINVHILYIHQLASGLMTELEDKCDKVMRIIHHQGHIIDFLSARELHQLIANSTDNFPPQLEVMTTNMIMMELQRIEKQLYIHCYLHIAERTTYNIISVTPIPRRIKGNIFATIKVDSPLLGVDHNNQRYFELSTEEFREAIHLGSKQYLTSPDVVFDMTASPNCILDHIYSRSTGNNCSHQTFNVWHILWKRLYMSNTWLFFTNEPDRVGLTCNGIREEIWLNESE